MTPVSHERIHTDTTFKDGNGPEPATVFAEATDDGETAIHVRHHSDIDPSMSVYLDPIGAAHLAAQLLAAARTSLPETGESR